MLINKKSLQSKIKILQNVKIQHLPLIYQLANALIFPSLYEGFGFPPLEAMSVNCPVIASNLASLPEICGDAAYFVNPYDTNEICNAMKEIVKNSKLKSSLIKKGRIRVKSFSMQSFVKNHLIQFESLL